MKDRDIILEVLQAGTDRRIERRRFVSHRRIGSRTFRADLGGLPMSPCTLMKRQS